MGWFKTSLVKAPTGRLITWLPDVLFSVGRTQLPLGLISCVGLLNKEEIKTNLQQAIYASCSVIDYENVFHKCVTSV